MSRTTRGTYWSNSKLANYLQFKFCGIKKPIAASMEDWRALEKQAKETCPFIEWLTEDFFDTVQNVVNYPTDKLYDLRYYIQNRFFSKLHYLKTGLEPGQYHELDTRIMQGLFTGLIDFIEVEKAWMTVAFDSRGEAKKKYKYPSWRTGLFRLGQWRCPEAGLDHLKWEITLDGEHLSEYERSPHQAHSAQEQYALYNWWKVTRPARPDPYEISGWSEICARERDFPTEITDEHKAALNKLQEIETAYEQEDDEMLTRLIKIRKSLWT